MPGFMGIRGLEPINPHDMERERREGHRVSGRSDAERRSMEKVQEILKDQGGDMTAYNGGLREGLSDCDHIAACSVDKIMSARVAVLSFDDNLLTVQGIFASVKFRHLPVVDDLGRVIGIISDRDFLRVVSPFFGTINEQNRDKEIMARKVGTIMTRQPICAGISTTIMEAVRMMNGKKISCLPIVESGSLKLLGIVTWKDVVRAFCPGAFNLERESSRLKSGVKLNPQTAESARIKAKMAESARIRARENQGGNAMSERRAASPLPSRTPRESSETRPLSLHAPQVGQQKPLPSSSAGRAGSELAAAQKERIREEYDDSGIGTPPIGGNELRKMEDDALDKE